MAKSKLVLDPTITPAMQKRIDTGKDNLSNGVEMPLSKADKAKVIFSKLESTNPMITDVMHKDVWNITAVTNEKVALLGKTSDDDLGVGITEDDGLILFFIGTPSEEVAIDTHSNRILSEAEAETEEETLGNEYPRFVRWDFRLGKVTITDGPSKREKLVQTADQQRQEGETSMFASMEKFFERMMGMQASMAAAKNGETIDPQAIINEAMASLTPEQIAAQAEMREIEAEDKELDVKIEAGADVEFEKGGADK